MELDELAAPCPTCGTEVAEQRWFTPKQVAEILNTSTMTVYRLINDGALLAIRVGRQLKVDPVEVRAFERRNIVEPGSLEYTAL
jgi:excisionase family DNA binding protein